MATATVTATVVSAVLTTVSATKSSATATSTTRAKAQGGVLDGLDPIVYDASNPILLFIVQAVIIIVFCRLLHYPLRYLGQPRVIAEVIGGILLGPSVMMRIPGFKANIFPTESMPILSNIANLGLIIFLFLTGLEVDLGMFRQNWRAAVGVSLASMALPFGLGYAIAWGLYKQFDDAQSTEPIGFGVYGLFIGTALAITAFPVLCRILTELKLLNNIVGVTALAAGVGNDVVGWILLALCVSLVNNSSGLTALWALLCVFGWTLFLVFGVRPCFIWVLRRNGSLQNGPTESMVCLTLLLVLTSAWFTGIIGIHPIFGGFLVGVICPHDGGFTVKLTEKIEDFLSGLFLPLYFALSGLSTNLGLLNNGITWAYVIGIISVAFVGKFVGGTLSARLCGMFWRESCSVGVLMSCKGLVELIVLNIGLQAKIISQRTFTMFVVMALITTVSTTPLTRLVYPLSYRQKCEKFRRGEIDWEGNPINSEDDSQRESLDKLKQTQVRRLLVYLRLDSLPGLFTFISILGNIDGPNSKAAEDGKMQTETAPRRHLQVHGIRLLELTERTSSVMQVTEVNEFTRHDPVVNTFRTFSQLHDLAVSGQVAVSPAASFPETLVTEATEMESDFVLIPWGERGLVSDESSALFTMSSSTTRFDDRAHLDFLHAAMDKAVCNTGIFIDNGFGTASGSRHEQPSLTRTVSLLSMRSHREPATLPVANKTHRIFFPFFGGVDDRVALRVVLQLAKNTNISLTIAMFNTDGEGAVGSHGPEVVGASLSASISADEPMSKSKAMAVQDELSAHDLGLLSMLQSSLPSELSGRVKFVDVSVNGSASVLLDEAMVRAGQVVGQGPRNGGDIVVLGRHHARFGDAPVAAESSSGYDLARTIGTAGARVVDAKLKASVLVIQAGGLGLEW
ncbi:K+/H+ antiporter 1 [Grosmannia clavigera kw1407]|uniref:K+/H+ antiporter 1 n=1 Tax=Grosmannia clavigera (strain kw1407 / UAMH 11150) TaxID=655863 RepID=F0X9I5_GROCL|nr:K+/H+ antiporter 1 [Grosmannia clavigera kw1407]EFX06136.1 K+/H+ antiporter 1 [Grosmannia clavigera kw1407]